MAHAGTLHDIVRRSLPAFLLLPKNTVLPDRPKSTVSLGALKVVQHAAIAPEVLPIAFRCRSSHQTDLSLLECHSYWMGKGVVVARGGPGVSRFWTCCPVCRLACHCPGLPRCCRRNPTTHCAQYTSMTFPITL